MGASKVSSHEVRRYLLLQELEKGTGIFRLVGPDIARVNRLNLPAGRAILRAGADKLTVNTAAIRHPELLTALAADVGGGQHEGCYNLPGGRGPRPWTGSGGTR